MRNKIVELNKEETNNISGGMDLWRHIAEPTITIVCLTLTGIFAYKKYIAMHHRPHQA
jgi:hypothetical protein